MMNKYKEALVSLTDWFHSYKDSNGVLVQERHITEDYRKAERTIGELVERATPKKPIYEPIRTYYDIPYTALCPSCKEGIGYEAQNLFKFCYKCGQALDWGNEDENKG